MATFTTIEYGGFVRGDGAGAQTAPIGPDAYIGGKYKPLPAKVFDRLENFAESTFAGKNGADRFLGVSRSNGRRFITAKKYVGVISLKDDAIEILPKIFAGSTDGDERKTKDIFLGMLGYLVNTPFKEFDTSRMGVSNLNILEVFIRMFADSALRLVKQGLKSGYVGVEENLPYLKGKLLIPNHIRCNHTNRARFYTRYDDFNTNRPENRLIKTALKKLLGITRNDKNRGDLLYAYYYFEGVDESANISADFAKSAPDRTMGPYKNPLRWCEIFLRGKSLEPFAGKSHASAFLFPMNIVFESYIAKLTGTVAADKNYKLETQVKRKYLFTTRQDEEKPAFLLKPDMLLTSLADKGNKVILDTKWKVLNPSLKDNYYGISAGDMYQMYAYCKKYGAHTAVLIYPKAKGFECGRGKPFVTEYADNGGFRVKIAMADLQSRNNTLLSLHHIIDGVNNSTAKNTPAS